jgi:mRNA-degrading endonuclease toxin of MazEF toxin-antitoxin module
LTGCYGSRKLNGQAVGGVFGRTPKGARPVTVFEALMIALTLGLLIVAVIDKSDKHNKK